MTGWWRRIYARLSGRADLPDDFTGSLSSDEHVLTVGREPSGPVVATNRGLWLPEPEGVRRIPWHLVSKAIWDGGRLTVTEADEIGHAGAAVLLRDRPPRRLALNETGRLPETVHKRVTGSIKSSHHRELPGGGAWFVQRKVPGQDGIALQVRGDAGTDEAVLTAFAEDVSAQLDRARTEGQHGLGET